MADQSQPATRVGDLRRQFLLEIVTPERLLVSDQVEALTMPGLDGEFGVLPHHTRMMTPLGIGELAYSKDGTWTRLAVSTGFVEVLPERVIVLAQTAEMAHEIDVARAEDAKRRAERRLAHPDSDTDIDLARAALQRAIARLKAARHRESKGPH